MAEKKKSSGFIVITLLFVISFLAIKYFNTNSNDLKELAQNDEKDHLESTSTCIQCHGYLKGFSGNHQELECISCHGGDNHAKNIDSSHFEMRTIPGNMSDAEESCGLCHPQAYSDLQTSLMTSNSGIISVDRYIFGESPTPDEPASIHQLSHSPADTHLRNLCSHCHLGNEKEELGPINEQSRGGGCNACHLNYSNDYENGIDSLYHPSLTLDISNDHCFGCHSRSGRISTNYEGWHETLIHKDSIPSKGKYRMLMDERVFKFIKEDIHHASGLECIDCHNYEDLMGDGQQHAHEEDAVKISCEDCHFSGEASTINLSDLSFTHRRILKLRNYIDTTFLATERDKTPLLNASITDNGLAQLTRKLDGQNFNLAAPHSTCTKDAGHKNISCTACHSQWAPQCLGCHSDFDQNAPGYDLYERKEMDGSWIEYAGEFLAEAPALGVKNSGAERIIKPAIPGMIMTLDKRNFPDMDDELIEFHRLYAQASPHTIGKKGRSCTSCHTNSLAIGYGRGKLTLIYNEAIPHWEFEAEYADLEDGLPSDAWIGFLEDLDNRRYSTRMDFLPFNLEEQKRILTVGACLTCHTEDSQVMLQSLDMKFDEYLKKLSPKCSVPEF